MSPQKPLVYLVLGAAGSGRREVLVDLIQDGLVEGDRPAVMISDAESEDAADARLPGMERWHWADGSIDGVLPEGATHIFFVSDGRLSPVDQAEVFKPWVDAQGGEVARVFCVIDCRLAENHPSLLAWYEACIHFSDVVLLNRREGVQNKWLSDFLGHFKKQFYPCLFEYVKDGRVRNPALILVPEARRMTHVFDEEQDWVFKNAEGEEIDEQDDEEEGELEAAPEQDPYFERRTGGRRVKELPDIARFLDRENAPGRGVAPE